MSTPRTSQAMLSARLYDSVTAFLRTYRIPFFASIIWGMIAHIFAFTNKLVNHDELGFLFTKGITIGSGRWGLVIVSPLLPSISAPWLHGLIAIITISIAICLIVRLFSLKNPVIQIILSGLIITFPSLTGTFCYMFTSGYYGVAFLLAVVCVPLLLLIPKTQKAVCKIFCFLTALVCSVLSAAIYQSYIAITASLLLLLLIQKLISTEANVKQLVTEGVLSVIYLALALGSYWICCKLIWSVTNISMNAYSQEAVTFQLSTIAESICNAYRYFWSYTFNTQSGLMSSTFTRCLHVLCLLVIGAVILYWIIRRRKIADIILLLFLILMLPLSINCMYIFIVPYHIHTLVLYGFIAFYILLAILIESDVFDRMQNALLSKICGLAYDAVIIALSVVLVSNIYTANSVYLNLHLHYENFSAFCTSVVAQLQAMPEFREDTPIAFVGTYSEPDFYLEYLQGIQNIVGAEGISPNSWSRANMFAYYIGQELQFVHDGKAEVLAGHPVVSEMPAYPNNGYIRYVDGTIVVKLSQ